MNSDQSTTPPRHRGQGTPRAWFPGFTSTFALGFALAIAAVSTQANILRVELTPSMEGTSRSPLQYDAVAYTNAFGQRLSVTRLDFLISNVALRRADKSGTWLVRTSDVAVVLGREGRTRFDLSSIPAGNYDRIRFSIGVSPRENHADPAGLPADHPLNPTVNGLHWSWQGGYVFLAIEGGWLTTNNVRSGYSWHLATDRLLTPIELPAAIPLDGDGELRIALNVRTLVDGRHRIPLTETTTSTHSRPGDALAEQLRENLERAFVVETFRSVSASPALSRQEQSAPAAGPFSGGSGSQATQKPEMAATATPYRLRIAAYFPRPGLPSDNPLTEEGVALGRRLFHEPLLSINNRQSCASCHAADRAFTEARATSIGAEGQQGTRNAMALLNLAWRTAFFWDGRAPSLREQVLMPITDPIEMHESLTNVLAKLRRSGRDQTRLSAGRDDGDGKDEGDYPAAFARAFGTPEVTGDRIARALEQFLLVQVSHDSKFDRSLAGKAELSAEEKRGFELFHTEYDPRRGTFGADCFHCHGGPLFQSQAFANNGLDADVTDPGRFQVSRKAGDRGRFAVPSLRNVAVTAPYMHNGRMATLEEVIAHYNSGVKRSDTLDPNLAKHPDGGLGLSKEDQRALVAFLRTLTEEPSRP